MIEQQIYRSEHVTNSFDHKLLTRCINELGFRGKVPVAQEYAPVMSVDLESPVTFYLATDVSSELFIE